jgi:hypothetical protein
MRYSPQDWNEQLYRRENLKSPIIHVLPRKPTTYFCVFVMVFLHTNSTEMFWLFAILFFHFMNILSMTSKCALDIGQFMSQVTKTNSFCATLMILKNGKKALSYFTVQNLYLMQEALYYKPKTSSKNHDFTQTCQLFYLKVTNASFRTNCCICRIWGSHGGEYEDGRLLGCSAVSFGRDPCCLNHHSAVMMEAANTYETLANFYQTTRRYSSEERHLRLHLYVLQEFNLHV